MERLPLDSYPDKVNEWCNARPKYRDFKKEYEDKLKIEAKRQNITINQLKQKISEALHD